MSEQTIQNESFTVKVNFNDSMRRFSVEKRTFDAFSKQFEQVLQIPVNLLRFRYTDEDGDLVTFSSTEELLEALRISKNNVLRVNVDAPHPPSSEPPIEAIAPPVAPQLNDKENLSSKIEENEPLLFNNDDKVNVVVNDNDNDQKIDDDQTFWLSLPVWTRYRIIGRNRKSKQQKVDVNDSQFFSNLPEEEKNRIHARAASRRKGFCGRRGARGRFGGGGRGRFGGFCGGFGRWKNRQNNQQNPIDEEAIDEEADRKMWKNVPLHIRHRIISRWTPDSAEKVIEESNFQLFQALPAHVQHRVRVRSASHQDSTTTNNNNDDDAELKPDSEQDRQMWEKIPSFVRRGFISRCYGAPCGDALKDEEFEHFQNLPAHVKTNIRRKAAWFAAAKCGPFGGRRFGRFGRCRREANATPANTCHLTPLTDE